MQQERDFKLEEATKSVQQITNGSITSATVSSAHVTEGFSPIANGSNASVNVNASNGSMVINGSDGSVAMNGASLPVSGSTEVINGEHPVNTDFQNENTEVSFLMAVFFHSWFFL